MSKTVISVPLDFPKVVPNDWDKWNKIWEKNKKISKKIAGTKNAGQANWYGLDIYVKDGIDASDVVKYQCDNINCPDLFSSLFDNLDKFPIELHVVRVVESIYNVAPHHDHATESNYHSLRSLLYNTNTKPVWYYLTDNNQKHYLELPETTNTWYYNDIKLKHGTDYYKNYTKQLIMYRGRVKEDILNYQIQKSVEKYKKFAIFE